MVEYSIIKIPSSVLTGGGRRLGKPTPTIFVAYRFGSPESVSFRERIGYEVRKAESLGDVQVTDGHVLPGKKWSKEIRETISRARLVVADVTNLNPEVLFECGFAWGLSRPILPVVQDSQMVNRLPRWLTDLQIGSFANDAGWKELIDSIADSLAKGRTHRPRLPEPIPGRTFWLQGPNNFEHLKSEFFALARDLKLDVSRERTLPDDLGEADESLVNEVCRSSLLVTCLHGSSLDAFVHFAAGVVAAHPSAGAAKRKLNRLVVIALAGDTQTDVLAESAVRTAKTVRIVGLEDLETEILRFGRHYSDWLRSQEEDSRGLNEPRRDL